ncbi:MAG: hypothetical protein AAF447_20910 [Myxococcota bacterium]
MKTTTLVSALALAMLSFAPATASASCSFLDTLRCVDMRGVAVSSGAACYCDIYERTPLRVANARTGDVGIVPIDGRGSEIVTVLTEEIGQFHRHAVMFWNDGRRTRHNTMYVFDGEDGSVSDPGGDYVRSYRPLIGKVRFDGDELRNGLPGALSQSIDDTFDRGRLSEAGLVLKPGLRMVLSPPTIGGGGGFSVTEPDRAAFERAVLAARGTRAYYKLGDYTDMDSMSRPWSSNRTSGDHRGSHCSGFITDFFRDEGLAIADVFYPRSLRQDVAEVLFTEVRDACRNEIAGWKRTFSGHWSACSNVANQVVNCFADRDCWDTGNGWRRGSGVDSGSAVSPDNLLPDEFRYAGTRTYRWDGDTLRNGTSSGSVMVYYPDLGTRVDHPGLGGVEPGVAATATSPFERVEALRYTGGNIVRRRVRL